MLCCLGIGLDTLALTAPILTVVVFDDRAFEEVFGDAVSVNSEGSLVSSPDAVNVTDGPRFDEANVARLLRDEPVASPERVSYGGPSTAGRHFLVRRRFFLATAPMLASIFLEAHDFVDRGRYAEHLDLPNPREEHRE